MSEPSIKEIAAELTDHNQKMIDAIGSMFSQLSAAEEGNPDDTELAECNKKIVDAVGDMFSQLGFDAENVLDGEHEEFTSNPPLTRGSNYSAGYDIPSREAITIAPLTGVLVKTGITLQIPAGYYFQLQTKSRHVIREAMMNYKGSPVPFSQIKEGKTPEEIADLMSKYSVYTKHPITVGAGLIDADYTQEIQAMLFNNSPTIPFVIKPGDIIAQGVILKHHLFSNEIAPNSKREGGFGSTK